MKNITSLNKKSLLDFRILHQFSKGQILGRNEPDFKNNEDTLIADIRCDTLFVPGTNLGNESEMSMLVMLGKEIDPYRKIPYARLWANLWKYYLGDQGGHSDLKWNGANTYEARNEAAERLKSILINQFERYGSQGMFPNIIAHSHGGNVAIMALNKIAAEIRRGRQNPRLRNKLAGYKINSLILLCTPYRGDYDATYRLESEVVGRIDNKIFAYSHLDITMQIGSDQAYDGDLTATMPEALLDCFPTYIPPVTYKQPSKSLFTLMKTESLARRSFTFIDLYALLETQYPEEMKVPALHSLNISNIIAWASVVHGRPLTSELVMREISRYMYNNGRQVNKVIRPLRWVDQSKYQDRIGT